MFNAEFVPVIHPKDKHRDVPQNDEERWCELQERQRG